MHKHKYERFLLNLLIERTLFVYNIVLSNQFNITKKYKKKCIRMLIELQKYYNNIRWENFSNKEMKYQFKHYSILMQQLDYLMKLFYTIDESDKFKETWTNKFIFYVSENIFLNPYYDKNYITDFLEFFIHISIKSLLTRDSNDLIYCNKFYLL